jgi:hypothetical protein
MSSDYILKNSLSQEIKFFGTSKVKADWKIVYNIFALAEI